MKLPVTRYKVSMLSVAGAIIVENGSGVSCMVYRTHYAFPQIGLQGFRTPSDVVLEAHNHFSIVFINVLFLHEIPFLLYLMRVFMPDERKLCQES
jgi:ABC-type uncharacterized transport system YnjBCD permease subunit